MEFVTAVVGSARAKGQSIVLTNGCFDVLHAGHVALLRAAAKLGHVLVVGVNDDSGVRALKGEGRPLFPVNERLELVQSIRWVDAVVVIEDLTADALIRSVRPDVYVKGSDYNAASGGRELPESKTLRELGVRIKYVPLVPGRSTTSLIERLRQRQ